ncbi:hypothetical protein AMTRI_Chr12g269620 [Amborella trichopoda]
MDRTYNRFSKSNLCWACIRFLGSIGFLLVGTSSYLDTLFLLFRWGFPGRNRRIFFRFLMRDIQSIRMEVKEEIDLSSKQLLIRSKHVSVRYYFRSLLFPVYG